MEINVKDPMILRALLIAAAGYDDSRYNMSKGSRFNMPDIFDAVVIEEEPTVMDDDGYSSTDASVIIQVSFADRTSGTYKLYRTRDSYGDIYPGRLVSVRPVPRHITDWEEV